MADEGTPTGTPTRAPRRDDGSDPFEPAIRVVLTGFGFALVSTGVIEAFVTEDGVVTASLTAAGFALVFVGYLGRYVTKIKFREFEADIERGVERLVEGVETGLGRVQKQAEHTVSTLESIARSYDSVRGSMRSGGPRDAALELELQKAEEQAQSGEIEREDIARLWAHGGDGERISVLGAMRGMHALRDFDVVVQAIGEPRSGFEQDRFLLLAGDMLPNLDEDQRRRLREAIEHQREDGAIKPHLIRWLTSERLLRLLER